MVKPNVIFTNALEKVLARVWLLGDEHLDDKHLSDTQSAIIDVRTIYRNKGEKLIGEKVKRYAQSIDFSQRRYRAGYIASFGERHAYLTYRHLKKVENENPNVIPEPNNGELTVTIVGAGAALEIFGLCYFYNEAKHRIRKLKINCIERISDWHSDRDTVIERVIKKTFSKLEVISKDIEINLVQDNISILSHNYDNLAETDIVLIYNVLNEITTNPSHQKYIWKNIKYILKICDKRVLILLMEPSAYYTRPRVQPIIERLNIVTKNILSSNEEEFIFDTEPLIIQFESKIDGLNKRLFGNPSDGHKPTFEKSLKRIHLACVRDPLSPILELDAERQFRSIGRQRDEKQRFRRAKNQSSFFEIDEQFGNQRVTKKYLNET